MDIVAGHIAALLLFIIGMAACFFGYRLFLNALGWAGFVIGALGAGLLLSHQTEDNLVVVVVAIIAGLLVSALIRVFYRIGVFLVGALLGILLMDILVVALDARESFIGLFLLVFGAVVVGLIALVVQRPMIILATAIGGAVAMMYSLAIYLSENLAELTAVADLNPDNLVLADGVLLPLVVAAAALAVIGTWFQQRNTRAEDVEI